jgi:hypothetical protein
MDIGKPQRIIRVEPLQEPPTRREPAEPPPQQKPTEPATAPAR